MALNIKNPEADALAHELAAATGESLTEAVTEALRARLEAVRRRAAGAPRPRAPLGVITLPRVEP